MNDNGISAGLSDGLAFLCRISLLAPAVIRDLERAGVDAATLIDGLPVRAQPEQTAQRVLDRHLQLMRAYAATGNRAIGLFSPNWGLRGQFGQLPRRLRERRYAVLLLYGEDVGGLFQQDPGSFYIGGGGNTAATLDFLDLIITPNAMDCLPAGPVRVLLDHLSFAPFAAGESRPGRMPPWPRVLRSYLRLGRAEAGRHFPGLRDPVNTYGMRLLRRIGQLLRIKPAPCTRAPAANVVLRPVTMRELIQKIRFDETASRLGYAAAFFPLYDYHLAPSRPMLQNLRERAQFFGMTPASARRRRPGVDARSLLGGIADKGIVSRVCIVPAGYPKLDANIAAITAASAARTAITYAPTPNDAGNKNAWGRFMSVNSHGAAIISALAAAFPDHDVVFKPYGGEQEEIVNAVAVAGAQFGNFKLDRSGSDYIELYRRTAVLVSDFSSTAYTFAFSTLRPVVFFSHNEAALQALLAAGEVDEYVLNRRQVGQVATNLDELVSHARQLLRDGADASNGIRAFRDARIFNVGHSEDYLVDHVERMLARETAPDWECFATGPGP